MDVTTVDRSAVLGTTPLHRAAATSKLVAAGLVLASVVVATDPLVVAGTALALVAIAAALGLPLRPMLILALYPALFALIFAFAAAPGPVTGALFVFKAITSALAFVTLMFTTPYPQVFAPVQRITPTVVGDALLMTYRSLFLLAEKFGDLLRAVRLRAGLSARQPIRSARGTMRALSGLLLYSLDLAEREYDILHLRGYEGGLRVTPQPSTAPVADRASVGFGLLALMISAAFRALPGLAGYSWLVASAGFVALVAGLVLRRRTR